MAKSSEGQSSFGSLVRDETPREEEGEEFLEDGVLFYVNKGGFPINDRTWDRMWAHIARINPDGYDAVNKVRGKKDIPEIPIPQPPMNVPLSMPVDERLFLIQKYMNELQYNHTGTQFYEIRKNRPISGLMETAREMIKEALPIKCLEAVILSLYLTNGILGMDRFPISFKTTFSGNTHRHVVLGVYHNGLYGALGMSRRVDLMYKDLKYTTLSQLLKDYIAAYKKYCHKVKKCKVGLPIAQDNHSYEQIIWKHLILNVPKLSKEEFTKDVEKFARELRSKSRISDKLQALYGASKNRPGAGHENSFSPMRRPSSLFKKEMSKVARSESSSTQPKKAKKKTTPESGEEDNEDKSTELSGTYQVRV